MNAGQPGQGEGIQVAGNYGGGLFGPAPTAPRTDGSLTPYGQSLYDAHQRELQANAQRYQSAPASWSMPQAYGNSGLARFGQPSQGMMGGYRPQPYTPMIFQPQAQYGAYRPVSQTPLGGMFGPPGGYGGGYGGGDGSVSSGAPSNNQGPTSAVSVNPGLAGMALGPVGLAAAMGINAANIGATPGAGNDADANAAAAANGGGMGPAGVGPGDGGASNSNGPADAEGGNPGGADGGGGGGGGK